MATKTETIQIRVSKDLKKKASSTLQDLGLDLSSGITIFLNQVVIHEAIPFVSMKKMKELHKKWDKEAAEALATGKEYTDIDELHRDILK
jgi:addiction module RelB/DinJ family antitoxin